MPMSVRSTLFSILLASACPAADLTGNWLAAVPNADGTARKTYFDLKQEGPRISGHIRANHFYYTLKETTGGPERFTLPARAMDTRPQRTLRHDGKLERHEPHT